MANPEHIEKLDAVDVISVVAYRIGISLFPVALLLLVMSTMTQRGIWGFDVPISFAHAGLVVASLLIAGNLHVYNKRVRYIITSSGWIGVALMAILLSTSQLWVAYGFMFVCLSGVALKESFCFKVVGLKLVPLLLMVAVAGFALNRPVWSIVVLVIACAILGYLAYEKWKMPLHFDIGNKANYQI